MARHNNPMISAIKATPVRLPELGQAAGRERVRAFLGTPAVYKGATAVTTTSYAGTESSDPHLEQLGGDYVVDREDRSTTTYQEHGTTIDTHVECGRTSGIQRKTFVTSQTGDLINETLQKQQVLIAKGRPCIGRHGLRTGRRMPSGASNTTLSRARTLKERWYIYLSAVEDDFFSSQDAILRSEVTGGKGGSLYNSLKVDETNNEDPKEVYTILWKAKGDAGFPNGAHSLFKSAIGQFCRMYIALRGKNSEFIYSLHKKGNLFQMCTDVGAVNTFMNHFAANASASTIRSKAVSLKKLVDHAETYFDGKENGVMSGRAHVVGDYLRGVANTYKMAERRDHLQRKTEKERVSRGDFLTMDGFLCLSNSAGSNLKSVMVSFKRAVQDGGKSSGRRLLQGNKDLIKKWCVNLIPFIMLNAGGQRPQVYAQLQLPRTTAEMREMKRMAQEDGYFQMRTILEKTSRATDMPYVIAPKSLLKVILFHCKRVRPAIVTTTGVDEGRLVEKTLLLHTQTGQPLQSWQITNTLQSFLKKHDPELGRITSMTLRGSFATIMLHLYRRGEIFSSKTEEQFLEILSIMMNTSAEQLRNAYISLGDRSMKDNAREFVLAMRHDSRDDEREGGDEDDGREQEGDEEVATAAGREWARATWP